MKEIPLRIEGRASLRHCTVTKHRITLEEAIVDVEGRGPIKEPFFTATISQLEALRGISQGLKVRGTAKELNRTEDGVRHTLQNARQANRAHKTLELIVLAKEFGLLNPLAIEVIKVCARSQQNSSPINVTDDFKQIGVELKV